MQRIYGDAVCASKANDQCILTPPAEQWMNQQNQGMEGGHCFGFSVAALSMFAGVTNPANYGGATAIDLSLMGNEALQREIAYSFVFQGFDPVRNGVIAGTPNEVLDKLIEILKAGAMRPISTRLVSSAPTARAATPSRRLRLKISGTASTP